MSESIIDLNEYKKAKIISKDIDEMLRVCDYTVRGMSKFQNKYKLAREIVSLIDNVVILLKINKDKYNNIINNKGITGNS